MQHIRVLVLLRLSHTTSEQFDNPILATAVEHNSLKLLSRRQLLDQQTHRVYVAVHHRSTSCLVRADSMSGAVVHTIHKGHHAASGPQREVSLAHLL